MNKLLNYLSTEIDNAEEKVKNLVEQNTKCILAYCNGYGTKNSIPCASLGKDFGRFVYELSSMVQTDFTENLLEIHRNGLDIKYPKNIQSRNSKAFEFNNLKHKLEKLYYVPRN